MVCFDTAPLIWGIRKPPEKDVQLDKVINTGFLMRKLDDESKRIMLPTLVVTEYLQGTPVAFQPSEFAVLTTQFVVHSFDPACARLAAQLCNRESHGHDMQGDTDWQSFKTDIGIVATAIIHNAECIYTGERPVFERIAAGRIRILDVPLPDLFGG